MNWFQIVGLSILLLALVRTTVVMFRHRMTWRAGLLWCAVWIAGIAALIDPEITVRVANFLGIRRGADLLIYCVTLALLGGFFLIYLRMRRLDEQITKLVREIALLHAEREGSLPSETGGQAR